MDCPTCGVSIAVRKNLQTGKAAQPDSCPECGESLDKSEGGNRDLIAK